MDFSSDRIRDELQTCMDDMNSLIGDKFHTGSICRVNEIYYRVGAVAPVPSLNIQVFVDSDVLHNYAKQIHYRIELEKMSFIVLCESIFEGCNVFITFVNEKV